MSENLTPLERMRQQQENETKQLLEAQALGAATVMKTISESSESLRTASKAEAGTTEKHIKENNAKLLKIVEQDSLKLQEQWNKSIADTNSFTLKKAGKIVSSLWVLIWIVSLGSWGFIAYQAAETQNSLYKSFESAGIMSGRIEAEFEQQMKSFDEKYMERSNEILAIEAKIRKLESKKKGLELMNKEFQKNAILDVLKKKWGIELDIENQQRYIRLPRMYEIYKYPEGHLLQVIAR